MVRWDKGGGYFLFLELAHVLLFTRFSLLCSVSQGVMSLDRFSQWEMLADNCRARGGEESVVSSLALS